MYKEIDKAVREYSIDNKYPNKIILGEGAFHELKEDMHKHMAMGLKVNSKGDYVSLFDMAIEIDPINKNRSKFGYMVAL